VHLLQTCMLVHTHLHPALPPSLPRSPVSLVLPFAQSARRPTQRTAAGVHAEAGSQVTDPWSRDGACSAWRWRVGVGDAGRVAVCATTGTEPPDGVRRKIRTSSCRAVTNWRSTQRRPEKICDHERKGEAAISLAQHIQRGSTGALACFRVQQPMSLSAVSLSGLRWFCCS
jgi:hypothetical protein